MSTTTVGEQGPQGLKGCCAEIGCLHTESNNMMPNTGFGIPLMPNPTSAPSLSVPFHLCGGRELRMLCTDRDGRIRVTSPGEYTLSFNATALVEYNDTVIDAGELASTPPNTIITSIYINGENSERRSETNLTTLPNNIPEDANGLSLFFEHINLLETIRLEVGDSVEIRMGMINAFGTIINATLLNSETDRTFNGENTEEGAFFAFNKAISRTCRPSQNGLTLPGCTNPFQL